jgi:hypothetical protein
MKTARRKRTGATATGAAARRTARTAAGFFFAALGAGFLARFAVGFFVATLLYCQARCLAVNVAGRGWPMRVGRDPHSDLPGFARQFVSHGYEQWCRAEVPSPLGDCRFSQERRIERPTWRAPLCRRRTTILHRKHCWRNVAPDVRALPCTIS